MFPFEDLCGRPVAAADYIALAKKYHTLVLRGVPVFTGANRNEAYRFLTLVDVLYEHHIRLVCSAQDDPIDLFQHILTREQLRESQSSQVHSPLGCSFMSNSCHWTYRGFCKPRAVLYCAFSPSSWDLASSCAIRRLRRCTAHQILSPHDMPVLGHVGPLQTLRCSVLHFLSLSWSSRQQLQMSVVEVAIGKPLFEVLLKLLDLSRPHGVALPGMDRSFGAVTLQ